MAFHRMRKKTRPGELSDWGENREDGKSMIEIEEQIGRHF